MSFVYNALNNVPVTNVNVVTFTSSGTYTPPANLRTAVFFLQGAGGGGGGAVQGTGANTWSAGRPGGGGRWGQVTIQAADITGNVTVTVGAGGAGGTGVAGSAGGPTEISGGVATRTVAGGSGGDGPATIPDNALRTLFSPIEGSVTGTFDWTGGPARVPCFMANRVGADLFRTGWSLGGSSAFGGSDAIILSGGASGGTGDSGITATRRGCGGSGAWIRQTTGGGNRTGGAGAAGLVIVYEFLAEAP